MDVFAIEDIRPDEEEVDALIGSAHIVKVPAKENILDPDSVFDQFWFIKEGMVRAYRIVNGKDYTVDFFTSGQFVWDWNGLDRKVSNSNGYETLFPTIYYYWNREDFLALLEKYPHLVNWRRHSTEVVFLEAVERLRAFQTMSLKERYSRLRDMHGDLINKVPQYHIASYLGVKPQSLSRIKNTIIQKRKP